MKIRTFILIGILVFALLTIPSYLLLKDVYARINNPAFPIYFIILAATTILLLRFYNNRQLKKIIDQVHKDSFIFDLQPFELVYLKTQRLSQVIDGTLNQLLMGKKISLSQDAFFQADDSPKPESLEAYQVLTLLSSTPKMHYKGLINILKEKTIFSNTKNSVDALNKYFIKSIKFGYLFYLNFSVLSILMLIGFTRLVTGILRDKPIFQIGMILFLLAIIIAIFLTRLSRKFVTRTVPAYYKRKIGLLRKESDDWEWDYFLSGNSIFVPVLIPIVIGESGWGAGRLEWISDNSGWSSDSGSCSSSNSSCGSSCSSCGGCGGD